MNPADLGLIEALAQLRAGRLDATSLREACASRAERRGTALGALRHRFEVEATEPPAGPLAGIPYLTKANIAIAGAPLDCCSRLLEGYRSPFDATVTRKLREAGAVVLGATNMDEFAMGSSTENSAFGPARNPYDRTRTPGGSSGGSAAAVAAAVVPFALGSDTGGSIRQPAGFCGVVGLKPTYGRVSRYGLTAFASSLDQIGPLARTVEDVAEVYLVLAGPDERDATSADRPPDDPRPALARGPDGLRIGVPFHLFERGLDDAVREDFESTLEDLRAAGASVVDVKLPSARYAVATYAVLATAEASSNLARYDGIVYGQRREGADLADTIRRTRSEGFGDEVKRRILLGTYVLSEGYIDRYYRRALRVRAWMREDHARAFDACDVLLTPTSPTAAFRLGERAGDPLQMALSDVFTVSANLTGLPAVSVPSGTAPGGLPLAVQFTAPAFDEGTLLRAARCVENLREVDRLRREQWVLDLDPADLGDGATPPAERDR